MIVRPAETKDIPVIVRLFVDLLDYLKSQNPDFNVSQDRDKVIGGVLRLIVSKMQAPGHIVMVRENDQGEVTHFLAGGISRAPEFSEYEIMAELNWLYPMNFELRPLADAFDRWAQDQGAVARWGFAANRQAEAVCRRNHMTQEVIQFIKPYKE